MIYNEYFASDVDLDNIEIDNSCIGEAGALETLIWAEVENRKFMEECFNSDFRELLLKEGVVNEGVGSWISDRVSNLIDFVKKVFSKIYGFIKSCIQKIKSFFSKEKDSTDMSAQRKEKVKAALKDASFVLELSDEDAFYKPNMGAFKTISMETSDTMLKIADSMLQTLNTDVDKLRAIDQVGKKYDDTFKDAISTSEEIKTKANKALGEPIKRFTKTDALEALSGLYTEAISFIEKDFSDMKKAEKDVVTKISKIKSACEHTKSMLDEKNAGIWKKLLATGEKDIRDACTILINAENIVLGHIVKAARQHKVLAGRYNAMALQKVGAKNEAYEIKGELIEDELNFIDDEM